MAMTHCSCEFEAPSSRESVGIVTFRLELPTNTIIKLRQSTARVHQRRAYTRESMIVIVSGISSPGCRW